MRKLIVFAVTVATMAVAGVALAGQAATAPNGRFIDLNVAVSPPVAGTAKAPQGVGVSFDSFTGNRINGAMPSHNIGVTVRLNKGFTENGSLFPSCTINPTAISQCPKATQIGTGTAEVIPVSALATTPTFVSATLVAYNGMPFGSSKAPTVIFEALLKGNPTPVAENDFRIAQQPTGPYGLALSQIVSPGVVSPFDITKFSIKVPDRTVTHRVHGKSVKVHLIVAPNTCHGSWQFAQTDTFSDAPPLTATDSQPCLKR
jgi:hypothetical protein